MCSFTEKDPLATEIENNTIFSQLHCFVSTYGWDTLKFLVLNAYLEFGLG